MKIIYKLFTRVAKIIPFMAGMFIAFPLFAQPTGTIGIEAKGPTSLVLVVDTTNATGFRVELSTDDATYTEVTEFADTTMHGSAVYLLADGLTEGTRYYYQLIPLDGSTEGTPVKVDATTYTKSTLSYHKFETETNGWITDEINGRSDSLWNASLQPTGVAGLDNAVDFMWTEGPPGVFTYSSVYLDSALWDAYDQVINGSEHAMSPTETSYMFWFKNNDPDQARNGSLLFMTGDQFGSAVGLYNDSIWVSTAGKWGSEVATWTMGYPLADVSWHHVAFVYNKGDVSLYLDGNQVINYSEDTTLFWSRYGTRADHWSKTQIGAAFWWNRPGNEIFPVNYGDQMWHNQFNGMMDELKITNYALAEADVQAAADEIPYGISTLEVIARGPNSVVLGIKSADADTFEVAAKTGEDAFAEVTPAKTMLQNGEYYYLINGLTENSEYTLQVTGMGDLGKGVSSSVDVMTYERGTLAYEKFNSEDNGWITEEIHGRQDSLINASLVETGIAGMDKAVKFQWTEGPPGVFTYSTVYLDSALWDSFDQVINGNEHAMSPTELSYTFWFKNNDPDQAKDPGSLLFMSGDQFGSAVGLYNDSIWVGTGAKYGGTNLAFKGGYPLSDTAWHHVAFVYKEGEVGLYLDGSEVITYSEDTSVFWSRLGVRADHWSKTQIGAAFWWNRPANGIFPANYGDKMFHNQFNGLMDELKFVNYAMSADEVDASMGEIPYNVSSVELTARGPNSVVLGISSADADTFMVTAQTGSEAAAEVTPAKTVMQNDVYYYLIDGLTEASDYAFGVTGFGDMGNGIPVSIAGSTRAPEMVVDMNFNSATDGWITNEVNGRMDSMINATLTDGYYASLEKAIQFEWTEGPPGVFTYSAVYLDSALWDIYDQNINGGEMATSPTEMSYSFWFKNNDADQAKDPGSLLFMSGDQFGSAVGLYNDSIWVATGAKFAGTNLEMKGGYPFTGDAWHHVAVVYKEGVMQLYLDGQEVVNYTEDGWFWNRFGVRMHDHWAKTMIGASKWWNRPANTIFPANYGDNQWHNQFNGLMDNLQIYTYALSADDVQAMVDAVTSVKDVRYNSVVIYPNPPRDMIYLKNVRSGNLSIYDVSGRMVFNQKITSDAPVNISQLGSGIYYVRVAAGNQVYTQKLVKE